MSFRVRSHTEKETPIERIFQRVTGRKMTPDERLCFHLNGTKPLAPGNSNPGSGLHRKNGSKLTRS